MLFQMFGVETYSFLPDEQSDGRDLAGQCEARHRWLHASSKASLVEILERSGCGRRSRGGALENIFQIVIVIFVQSADGQDFGERLSWLPTKRYSPLV